MTAEEFITSKVEDKFEGLDEEEWVYSITRNERQTLTEVKWQHLKNGKAYEVNFSFKDGTEGSFIEKRIHIMFEEFKTDATRVVA